MSTRSTQDRARTFDPIRVVRRTGETRFEIVLRPRVARTESLPLPNRLLSHFIDHFSKACGVQLELVDTAWPGSWEFDHVLCEDLGQLIGRGLAEIQQQQAERSGIAGRASVSGCMDDGRADLVLGLEGRPRATWELCEGITSQDLDGFVDSWYEQGRPAGQAWGTNLRQFVDGLVLGAGATLAITVREAGNLHHFYEVVFRALGDAFRIALDLEVPRLAGDQSGLAGRCDYSVEKMDA